MPKIKTNKSAAKRLRRTKNGKIKRNKAGARHLALGKSAKRKRNLRQAAYLEAEDLGRLRYLLPYGK